MVLEFCISGHGCRKQLQKAGVPLLMAASMNIGKFSSRIFYLYYLL